jgi:hypothetical protein
MVKTLSAVPILGAIVTYTCFHAPYPRDLRLQLQNHQDHRTMTKLTHSVGVDVKEHKRAVDPSWPPVRDTQQPTSVGQEGTDGDSQREAQGLDRPDGLCDHGAMERMKERRGQHHWVDGQLERLMTEYDRRASAADRLTERTSPSSRTGVTSENRDRDSAAYTGATSAASRCRSALSKFAGSSFKR